MLPVIALLFTMASFWWIWLRPGRLHSFAPQTFASVEHQGGVLVRFPLVLHNTGATPVVVEHLRLVINDRPVDWTSIRRSVRPLEGDLLDNAAPFAVPGRSARELHAEFRDEAGGWLPEPGCGYPVTLEWLTKGKWRRLVAFTWWAPARNQRAYIVHWNRPAIDASEDT
jgi:hypothetical protein